MAKAKAKKRKGTKIRDLKPRKAGQVKGGVHLSEDPCAGGKLR